MTPQKILDIITKQGSVSIKELCESLNLSRVAIHKHLARLIQQHQIEKRGSAPLVRYVIASTPIIS